MTIVPQQKNILCVLQTQALLAKPDAADGPGRHCRCCCRLAQWPLMFAGCPSAALSPAGPRAIFDECDTEAVRRAAGLHSEPPCIVYAARLHSGCCGALLGTRL